MSKDLIYPDQNFIGAGILLLTWHKNELHCLMRVHQKHNFILCWNFFGGKRRADEYASETASRLFEIQSTLGISKDVILSLMSSNSYPIFLPNKNFYLFVLFVDLGDHHVNSETIDLIPWGSICRDKNYQGIVLSQIAIEALDNYNLHKTIQKFLNNNGFVQKSPLLVFDSPKLKTSTTIPIC